MSRRIYLDDCAHSRRLEKELRKRGFDVETPRTARLTGADDDVHFEHGRATSRAVLTFNAGDFHDLHTRLPDHAGAIVVYLEGAPGDMRASEIAEALQRARRALGNLAGRYVVLNQWRRG